MTDNKKHIDQLSEFSRYLNDQMSPEERYRMERSMERDPFEAEALEGFSVFKIKDIEHDLENIDVIKGKRHISKQLLISLSTAAAILIIAFSVFQIQKNYKGNTIASKIAEPTETGKTEILADKMGADTLLADSTNVLLTQNDDYEEEMLLTQNVNTREKDKSVIQTKNKTQETTTTGKQGTKNEIMIRGAGSLDSSAPKIIPDKGEAKEEIQVNNNATDQDITVYRGKVVSKDNNEPLAGVNIIAKGNRNSVAISDANGNFSIKVPKAAYPVFQFSSIGMNLKEVILDERESEVIALAPSMLALDEVVVTSKSKESRLSAESEPFGGMKLYRDYLDNNIQYPKEIENPGRESVRMKFKISLTGEPYDVEAIKSPGDAFTFEATRLILKGPKWAPAVKNGKPAIGEVNLRIVFKP